MTDAPEKISTYLNDEGYNPYSPTRSRIFSKYIVEDILDYNPRLEEDAESGAVVYDIEYEIAPSVTPKLVLGTVNEPEPPTSGPIEQTAPDQIWCAMSYASIMTQHNQNTNNRVSEARLISFEAYEMDPQIVTASLVLTNIAEDVDFDHLSRIRTHPNVENDVRRIIDRFGSIEGSPRENTRRPDSVGCIVIDFDGTNSSVYLSTPAPEEGDQLFYPDFVAKISNEIDSRFYDLPHPVNASPEELITFGEGRTIDFKSRIGHPQSLASEAAAFMNTDGGVILLGINDDSTIEGLDDIDRTHNRVSSALYDHLDGDISYETERVILGGEDVLMIRLPKSRERLYEVDGKFYLRVGESKKAMRFDVLRSHFINLFQDNPEQLFH